MKCKYCPKELEGRKQVCFTCKREMRRKYAREHMHVAKAKKEAWKKRLAEKRAIW